MTSESVESNSSNPISNLSHRNRATKIEANEIRTRHCRRVGRQKIIGPAVDRLRGSFCP